MFQVRNTAVLGLLFAGGTYAQSNSPVTRGLENAIRINESMLRARKLAAAAEHERALAERERVAHEQLIQERKDDAARAQRERENAPLMRQIEKDKEAEVRAAANAEAQASVDYVKAKYPDFEIYSKEVDRLATLMAGKNLRLEELAEMFYLAAKYASFSQSPDAVRPPAH